MASIWKGALAFGLVNIPVELRSAVRSTEKLSFRQLDKKHHKPIRMERVSTVDGKTVEWDDIEKGRARNYSEKTKQGIMRALGWTRESWDLILAGGEPELAPESGATRLEGLERRFDLLEAAVRDLLARFPGGPPAPPAA